MKEFTITSKDGRVFNILTHTKQKAIEIFTILIRFRI